MINDKILHPTYSGVRLSFYTYYISPIEMGLLWAKITYLKSHAMVWPSDYKYISVRSFKWSTKHWFWSRGKKSDFICGLPHALKVIQKPWALVSKQIYCIVLYIVYISLFQFSWVQYKEFQIIFFIQFFWIQSIWTEGAISPHIWGFWYMTPICVLAWPSKGHRLMEVIFFFFHFYVYI